MFKKVDIWLKTNKLFLDDPVYIKRFVKVTLHEVRSFETLQIKLDITRLLTEAQSSEQCAGLHDVVL